MTKPPKTLGDRLRWLRRRFDMSLEEFATPLSIGTSYLSKLECGVSTNPSPLLLEAICREFFVAPQWLAEGHGKPFLLEEFNQSAEAGEVIPSPVPERLWAPLPSNYIDQLKAEALFLQNRGEEMVERAAALQKQAREFEAFEQRQALERQQIAGLKADAQSRKPPGQIKPLNELLAEVRRLTKPVGMKKKLANDLKVPQSRVSEWLGGKYEPGGDIALRLLAWVEEQERAAKQEP